MYSRLLWQLNVTFQIRETEDDPYYVDLTSVYMDIHWTVNNAIREKVDDIKLDFETRKKASFIRDTTNLWDIS